MENNFAKLSLLDKFLFQNSPYYDPSLTEPKKLNTESDSPETFEPSVAKTLSELVADSFPIIECGMDVNTFKLKEVSLRIREDMAIYNHDELMKLFHAVKPYFITLAMSSYSNFVVLEMVQRLDIELKSKLIFEVLP